MIIREEKCVGCMSLRDVQKITRAIARAGVHRIEPHNPIHSMIADQTTGDLKPELLGERVLSAIIEFQVGEEVPCAR